jgi:hypothetical protein
MITETSPIARQRLDKHVSAAKDMHATRDETLKNVIDMYN